MEKYFYSNCLIEGIKHKLKHPKQVKLTIIMPWHNEVFCPHVLWSDGKHDYDFGIEGELPLALAWTLHKGHIRCRELGFNQKWKKAVITAYKKRKGELR